MSTTVHPKFNVTATFCENANFSKSKQKFSFPRGQRFNGTASLLIDSVGYDLPST